MSRRGSRVFATRCLPALLVSSVAWLSPGAVQAAAHSRVGQTRAAHTESTPGDGSSATLHFHTSEASGGNKDPISIQAMKLDYYDKEQKLIYRGNVVAVRGDTTLKTPMLTVFLTPKAAGAPKGPPSTGSQVRRMIASGPVTIISKGQIATGDSGLYIKAQDKIYLDGNVALSQGPNVTKGDHLVYDTNTDQAVVTGHVRSMFVPENNDDTSKTTSKTADKPQTTARRR